MTPPKGYKVHKFFSIISPTCEKLYELYNQAYLGSGKPEHLKLRDQISEMKVACGDLFTEQEKWKEGYRQTYFNGSKVFNELVVEKERNKSLLIELQTLKQELADQAMHYEKIISMKENNESDLMTQIDQLKNEQ